MLRLLQTGRFLVEAPFQRAAPFQCSGNLELFWDAAEQQFPEPRRRIMVLADGGRKLAGAACERQRPPEITCGSAIDMYSAESEKMSGRSLSVLGEGAGWEVRVRSSTSSVVCQSFP